MIMAVWHSCTLLSLFVFCLDSVFLVVPDWHFQGPNIAINKDASQLPGTYQAGSPSYKSYPASLAVDGDDNDDFGHGSCSHTTQSSYGHIAQWKVDLAAPYKITGIVIVNRKDLKYRLKDFVVYGCLRKSKNKCLDDSEWDQIYKDHDRSYLNSTIDITVNSLEFSVIAINLPSVNSGPSQVGGNFLTLCEVKIYAAKNPACNVVNNLANGYVEIFNRSGSQVQNMYTVGTILKLSCVKGFLMTGSNFLECLQSGQYNDTMPSCDVACSHEDVVHGHIVPRKALYAVTEVVTVVCYDGFQLANTVIYCQYSGLWNGSVQCKQIQCGYPGLPYNGYYMKADGRREYKSESLSYRSIILGKCNTGFENNGNDIRKCQNDGTWSGKEPECWITFCSSPRALLNGEYFHNGTTLSSVSLPYNTYITATCDKGYKLIGNSNITCGANKTWDEEPVCKIVACEYPDKPTGGSYAFTTRNGTLVPYVKGPSHYLDVIQIICPRGNVLMSKTASRRCLETGSWNGEKGQCVLVTCARPEELEGGYYNYTTESTSDGYQYNTVLTAYCNGRYRLSKPEKSMRRCTEEGIWDEEPVVCISDEPTEKSMVGIIAGTTVSAVVVLGVISVIIVVVYRREHRGQHRNNNKGNVTTSFKDLKEKDCKRTDGEYVNVHERQGSVKTGNDYETVNSNIRQNVNSGEDDDSSFTLEFDRGAEGYYNLTNIDKMPKTGIPLKELHDLVLTGDEAKENFKEQFESLPQGLTEPHFEALKLQNRGKNRYRNLYAYDDTRVVLETDEESPSDYINACYVDGFKKTRQYIASQGPTKETLGDFWRMVWHTDCGKIVMLTNLNEEGKTKCTQYWPDEGSNMYGRINVTSIRTEIFSQFLIREFSVSKSDCMGTTKMVTQFHFTAWPDQGVPKHASSLVDFLSKVKNFKANGRGPVAVHCSAGIGRTGTFIALDFLTEQGKCLDYVDVVGAVTTLRKQRVNLVQTLEQYIFVHHALVESLMLTTSALPASTFPGVFQELLQMDIEKKKLKICVEFETLKKVSPVTEECQYVSSKLVRNRQKNRYSNVLPVEEFMPQISDGLGRDDSYINAVFLPSYKDKKAFIITQTPLESTIQDFWNLVWEHDIHTIVMVNSFEEMKESEKYWPCEGETFTFESVDVTNSGEHEENGHIVLSLTVKSQTMKRELKQVRCGQWSPKQLLPASPDIVLTLMELVQRWQQQTGDHTILVHCMNGADKSGLYCVISAVIERTKIEQDVAISHVIEEMRNAREQIIPSVDQFKFCHEAVLAFLHQYDTYSNFTD